MTNKFIASIFSTFLVFTNPKIHFGQTVSIKQLIEYRTLDNDELNDILVSEGWEFVKNDNFESIWAFDKSGDVAKSWICKSISWDEKWEIQYKFYKTKFIGKIKSDIKNLGFIKKSSETLSESIFSEFVNLDYFLTIKYEASSLDNKNDSYTIIIKKRKSLKERLREEKERKIAELELKRIEKECEINRAKRNKRDNFFSLMVDSINKNEETEWELPVDSGAAIPIEKIGYTIKEIIIYKNPNKLSKAISGLFKNEKVKIRAMEGDYYFIEFDYCYSGSHWDYIGWVLKKYIYFRNPKKIKKN